MTRRAAEPWLTYREVTRLPRLAWLASADPATGETLVYHGASVERRDGWMVEGVWDDAFECGDFHRSDHFFGTGIRVAQGRVHFVPASSPIGRLLHCTYRERVLVSNSLALLLAFTGAELDPAHDYRRETYAIRQGVGAYPREFVVAHPEIAAFRQLFDEVLVLGDGEPACVSLRTTQPIPSYAAYRALVADALGRLRVNWTSAERRVPMTPLATISSGYDSAAAAVLVKELGVETCFTARRSNTHMPRWLSPRAAIDDGKPIADRLGLRTIYLDRSRSRLTDDELFFLAPGCAPTSLALHSLARDVERRGTVAVLFTGFLGDEVWDRNPWEKAYQRAGILRGDTTALMLSEIRLKSGFINVAVPSLGARNLRDLEALADAPEMAPWRLGTSYDRPVARRILDDAGIPSRLFGQRKKAVVDTNAYPVNRALRAEFFRYVRTRCGCSGAFVYLHDRVNRLAFPFYRGYHLLRRRLWGTEPPDTPRAFFWKRFDFGYLTFTWAAHTLSARLRAALREAKVAPASAPAASRALATGR